MSWLINAAQLDKFRKNQKNLIIFDASLHLDQRNPKQEFIEKHIIDAQFFDIDFFSDPNIDLPHMLIHDEKILSEKCSSLGIRNDYKIIFYDNSDLHSACRALWMLKMFGHNPNQLYILDGGFKAWEKFGGKIESGEPTITPRSYTTNFQSQYLCTLSQMKQILHGATTQIVDMRHPVRYAGGPEIRPGLRQGHIPGSISFPFSVMFDKEGAFLPLEKIRKKMTDINIDLKAPIVSTCGSAVTAAILDFVLELIEHPNHIVYDGSFSEWGAIKLYPGEQSLDERPVETCLEE
jgi:thiosulfate/3-mercaptopyruvate sulfurtransferase